MLIYPQAFVQTHVQAHSYFQLLEKDVAKQLTESLNLTFWEMGICLCYASKVHSASDPFYLLPSG